MRCRPLHSVRSPRPAYVARPASGQHLRTACSERQLSEPWMTASGLHELLQRVDYGLRSVPQAELAGTSANKKFRRRESASYGHTTLGSKADGGGQVAVAAGSA